MRSDRETKTFIQVVKNGNFIVRDHLVHGVRILPGVVLLDMIYRLAGTYLGTQAIELENVLFKQPISTSEEFDQSVHVTFAPRGTTWSVTITSQKVKGDTPVDAKPSDILECTMALRASGPGPKVDVQAVIAAPDRRWDLDAFYAVARAGRIEHLEFMKTRGLVYQRGDRELMEIQLGTLAERYRGSFHAHPALLDASTLAGSSFLLTGDLRGGTGQGTPFIPFLIARFCIHRPLPRTVYAYSTRPRLTDGDGAGHDDFFATDITICDEHGEVLVELERFTCKRVRESNLITRLVSPVSVAPPTPSAERPIVSGLQAKIADLLGRSPAEIDARTGFYELGLDSTQLLGLVKWLEGEIGAELYPTLLFEYATIARLTDHLREHHPAAFTGLAEASQPSTPDAGVEGPDARHAIVRALQDGIARELGIQPASVGVRTGFYDLGLDSTQLLRLVRELEQRVGEALYPTLLFEYSTVERLADHLLEKHAGAFGRPAQPARTLAAPAASTGTLVTFQPAWVDASPLHARGAARAPEQRLVVLHGAAGTHEASLRAALGEVEIVRLDATGPTVSARFEQSFERVLLGVQSRLRERSSGQLLVQIVADAGEEGSYAHALGALLATAHQENPRLRGQVIGIEGIDRPSVDVVRLIDGERSSPERGCSHVRFVGERLQRQARTWRRIERAHAEPVYRDGGVYLVTGGLGGLGTLVAEHLLRRAKVRVALLGRSPVSPSKLDRLRRLGGEVLHVQADLGDEAALQRAVQGIRARLGALNGVFHLAGSISDRVIVQKDPSESRDVLRPKVRGLENLDRVTREDPLDLFVTFSSLSAVFGNLGQGDYACANAFMDCFVEHRHQLVRGGARSGKSISINWPLWRAGGMQIDHELERAMFESTGMMALPAEDGLQALDDIIGREPGRTLVAFGDEQRMLARIGADRPASASLAATVAPEEWTSRFASRPDDVAVVGLSGRYPMASSLDELYDNLKSGRDCTSRMPTERWKDEPLPYDVERLYEFGGFIDKIDCFDPLFFNIPPRNAELMDPQARLFLQAAWEACEDAGFHLDRAEHDYQRRVGVFAGVFWSHYELFAAERAQRGTPMAFGVTPAAIPNTVSYVMNFHGPSMAVDSMCSSSLTSIHLACESIRRGECQYAVAGGVNVATHPHKYMFLTRAGFLSTDGKCRSFGEGGDGYVPGEGVGAVLLTTVEEAERQGYPIHGVLRGSAVNHVGKTSGLSVPDPVAQGEVIGQAFRNADVDPATVSYVEAHGTGTSLGDPIEIQGLNRAFRQSTDRRQFCAVGSVKSNIGHLEAAAGIVGLTKVLLQLRHGQLFPSLHGTPRNPFIPFESTAFYLVDHLQAWDRPVVMEDGEPVVYPRRAGLSSFGASGSNAHVAVEEYVARAPRPAGPVVSPTVVPLSARTPERLTAYARKLEDFLRTRQVELCELAYTYQVGREPFEHRVAFVVRTPEELLERLSAFARGEREIPDCYTSAEPATVEGGTEAARIGRRWAAGEAGEWHALYGRHQPRRISAPTYPFAEDRYWVPRGDGQTAPAPAATSLPEPAFFAKQWTPGRPAVGRSSRPGVVIVLQTRATASLAAALFEGVGGVEAFHAVHGDTDFCSAEAGAALHSRVKQALAGRAVLGLIDLTAHDVEYERSLELEAGKITLIQRLVEHDRAAGLTLLQLTHDLADCQTPAPTLQGARLAGLYRMLGSEYRDVRSISVDTDARLDQGQVVIEQTRAEWFSAGPGGPSEVCYRAGARHLPALVQERTTDLRRGYAADEVILITGGTRGIGAAVAEHVVAQGCRRLILLGREVLPPASAWRTARHEKVARLQRLVEQGVDVRYFSTPLTDADGLRDLVDDVRRHLGPIRGVFHCAGVMGGTPAFFQKEIPEIQAVREPKVGGLATLAGALEGERLAFFVLFSSVSSLAPALATGQSDYAMANAFMDAFAAHQVGQGRTWFRSLQWPAWREVGMAAGEASTPAYDRTGLATLATADGLRLLDLAIAGESTVGLPCVCKPGAFSADALLRSRPPVPVRDDRASVAVPSDAPLAVGAAVRGEGRDAIRSWLRDVFTSELKLTDAQLQDDKRFDEYGIDSILIAQLVKVLQSSVGKKLAPALLLEHSSLTALVDYFAEHHDVSVRPARVPAAAVAGRAVAASPDDIAVVGISCRFPDAPTKEAFWDLLTGGRRAIRPVSGRWMHRRGRTDHGGWLDDTDLFDPAFFRINDADAAVMDPQARVILEESLKAIYDAGYDHQELSGAKVGVYVGARPQGDADVPAILSAPNPVLAISPNYLASNISRFFNLRGPSLVVDTACSSALTGMGFAVDALKAGRIEVALVGAVSLILTPLAHDVFDARDILNREGRFELFGKQAGGEVLGEGAGIVVLKRLGDAIRDGNQIYGVLKAIASNNDGRTLGPGSPNIEAQRQVLREALEQSGKRVDEVGYIEINGGGSPLLDSIEIKALSEVYQLSDQALPACAVGSIKPNVGHLLLASGLAGFIRCVLSVYHRQIPPFLSAVDPFEHYDFASSRIRFNREVSGWDVPPGARRVAAQSSFADGGTNCHVVIEELVAGDAYQQRYFPRSPPVLARRRFPPRSGGAPDAGERVTVARWSLGPDEPIVQHHVVQGTPVLPGLAYVDMLYEVARRAVGVTYRACSLERVVIYRQLTAPAELEITFEKKKAASWSLTVRDVGAGAADTPYVTAELREAPRALDRRLDAGAARRAASTPRDLEEVYAKLRGHGLIHQGVMKAQGTIHATSAGAMVELRVQDGRREAATPSLFHPALLDGAAVAAAVLGGEGLEGDELFLPVFYEAFYASEPLQTECLVSATLTKRHDLHRIDLAFFDRDGRQVAELVGLTAKRVGRPRMAMARRAAPSVPPGRHTELEATLRTIFARHLKHSPGALDLDTAFFELGLESSQLLMVIKELEDALALSLHPTLLFETSSLRELMVVLRTKLEGEPRAAAVAPPSVAIPARGASLPPAAPRATSSGIDIAVVGMAGRYPRAYDLRQFWKNLEAGLDCITEVPEDRWSWKEYHSDDRSRPGHIFSKWGGFIEDHDRFDPMFFNIAPREADAMDPQERLFLEHCWAALEDAGYGRDELQRRVGPYLPGQVGVFAGAMFQEYPLFAAESSVRGDRFGLPGGVSSISSRVSYFCNFHGPSLTVDTMCSSSLTAIYLACQLLRGGRIDSALAGGVNLSIHPNKYLALSQAQFLSAEGHCRSFGVGGDGYIPGEGVGVLYLKRLEDAERDRDHIYGVIKGVAVNHGGKASGYTVPNPRAQGAVIAHALDESGLDPRTITYVEAHGTGTKLGDPIEIAGLASAFGDVPKQYCRIGSAKSNIGHCESAAGVAGVTKVLLQMEHGRIVPSLHAEELNPNIDFAATPFVVNRELVEWSRPIVDGHEHPRRAGVSSFGGSGANAHLIIEEYVPTARAVVPERPAIIVLSAKSADRLHAVVSRLVEWIDAQQVTDARLAEVAYTLQVGREAMDVRLGFVASSIGDVRARLQEVLDGKEPAGLFRGSMKDRRDVASLLAADEDVDAILDAWAARQKYAKIVELWVKGISFDWNKLYPGDRPDRISLPTYPFARDRHWVTQITAKARIRQVTATALHPLLHRNTSNLEGLRFSSVFSGAEPFLADHVVAGEKLLPGAASLEMARAAVEQVTGGEGLAIVLKDVVWLRPVAVTDAPVAVHVGLADERGELAFEVYVDGDRRYVHAQGRAELVPVAGGHVLDLPALQAACAHRTFTAEQCYDAYRRAGVEYGPAHRGIVEVRVGADLVLARLALPTPLAHTQDHYVLHPSLLDAAFQAVVALIEDGPSSTPMLPFALQRVEVLSPCTSSMWACIRRSAGTQLDDKVRKLDLDLCDEQGAICVRIQGLAFRALGRGIEPGSELMLFAPHWIERPAPAAARTVGEQLVLLCGWEPSVAERVQASLPGIECRALQADDPRFETYAARAFTAVQHVLRGKPAADVRVRVVVADLLLTGLSGLLQTAERENPRLKGQLILIEAGATARRLIDVLAGEGDDRLVDHRDGRRLVREWSEVTPADGTTLFPRDRGIYLITGGAGGLGLIFAREIADRCLEPTVVLAGRSSPGDQQRARIAAIEEAGARVLHRLVDVTDRQAVEALVREVASDHDALHGVIHCAGVKKDGFIIKKTTEDLREVLAAKVAGTRHLDEATASVRLDFFLLCSSVAGAMGNVGQADYAMGNAFMDAFAAHRDGLVARGARHGHTVSINWPLWRDGGMQLDPQTEKRMMEATGLRPMATSSGLRALHQAFAAGQPQIMALEGDRRAVRDVATPGERPSSAVAARPAASDEMLHEATLRYLKKLLSSVIQTSPDRIDADAAMEQYGIDSVMIMELTRVLEKAFGSLSRTLFFEYQTIAALADHFLAAHRTELVALLGTNGATRVPVPAAAVSAPANGSAGRPRLAAVAPMSAPPATRPAEAAANGALDIAIIGLSGRYPQARDLAQLWTNLREGRDSITEVPRERWDHSQYFDADKDKPGKTYAKWGGFIDGVELFDPLFFNISPLEAALIDPQERLFLECAFETLEGAGYARGTFAAGSRTGPSRSVGVFVGVMYEEYQLYGAQSQVLGEPFAASGNPSSVANRVSYFFNLQGPSMAVDTMCSSSLTAIHLACQSIVRGECEMAVAGGVNVSVHPNKYLMLGQAKFASSKGRCESFGAGGDGYVPGEGVGAVLLKPLDRAIRDGDQVHGVIKSTAINHGGKTNGYTVPNPTAQTSVIRRAHESASVNPRAVSYIEAHGTGTFLGDPIEITGLARAFQPSTDDRQFCAIGSIKSNIGHCESAAGIAGVTKVLLQMKHGQLVPSLHAETLNPNIDFAQTPFHVQRELSAWKRPIVTVDGVAREVPRLAGISSFGAGGSNAHVVVEEYIQEHPAPGPAVSAERPAWIVLSARTKDQLREVARRLVDALGPGQLVDDDLPGVAYTLQTGRDAMDERLALTAASILELRSKLETYLDGDESGVMRGSARRDRDQLAGLTEGRDVEPSFGNDQLLALWTRGLAVDWTRLYGAYRPRRVALPTYPFARKRYWVPSLSGPASAPVTIHPLVHQNMTDLDGIRFTSTFSGQEPFLVDHRVNGAGVLPGVAYLEMARAAVAAAAGSIKERKAIRLCNIVWARPIVAGAGPVPVQIGLERLKNGDIAYRISQDGGTVNSQGIAVFRPVLGAPTVDIGALQASCSAGAMSAAQCYEAFASVGIEYGPAHRAVEAIRLGVDEVLARLVLPAQVADTLPRFVLHPSLLDAALQSSVGLVAGRGQGAGEMMLPFALDQLDVYQDLSPAMWAHVRRREADHASSTVSKIDIDLMNDAGAVCVRLRGLSSRTVKETRPRKESSLAMLVPRWTPSPARPGAPRPGPTDRLVVVGGTPEHWRSLREVVPRLQLLELAGGDSVEEMTRKLQALGPVDHVLWIAPTSAGPTLVSDALIVDQERGVLLCFRFVKAMLALGLGSRSLGFTAITTQTQSIGPDDPIDPTHAGLHGLLGSMAKEHPGWSVRVADMPRGSAWPLAELFGLPADPDGNARAYRDGRWYELQLLPMERGPAGPPIGRHGGVHVVVGGAGGIGQVWSESMIRRYQAQIVWIGRRPVDAAIQAKIDGLGAHGPRPVYLRADAADLEQMRRVRAEITRRFGPVHGLVHSAIVLLDQSLANMPESRFRSSLASKVDVSVRMAQVFAGEPLDFALFFSSINSFTRGPGQSNYVAGCVFKDALAQALAREWPCAVKVINWGYWGSVGVVASKAYRERMAQAGIGSIEPAEAMEALDILMSGPENQAAIVKTVTPTAQERPASMISRMRRHLAAPDGKRDHA